MIFSTWAICACLLTTVTLEMNFQGEKNFQRLHEIKFPFKFAEHICYKRFENTSSLFLSVDSSAGAEFFAVISALSLLYGLLLILVYAFLDEAYKAKAECAKAVSREMK